MIFDMTDDVRTCEVDYAGATLYGSGNGVDVKKIHFKKMETTLCSFHFLQMFRLIFILDVLDGGMDRITTLEEEEGHP